MASKPGSLILSCHGPLVSRTLTLCTNQIEASTSPPLAIPRVFEVLENFCLNTPFPGRKAVQMPHHTLPDQWSEIQSINRHQSMAISLLSSIAIGQSIITSSSPLTTIDCHRRFIYICSMSLLSLVDFCAGFLLFQETANPNLHFI